MHRYFFTDFVFDNEFFAAEQALDFFWLEPEKFLEPFLGVRQIVFTSSNTTKSYSE